MIFAIMVTIAIITIMLTNRSYHRLIEKGLLGVPFNRLQSLGKNMIIIWIFILAIMACSLPGPDPVVTTPEQEPTKECNFEVSEITVKKEIIEVNDSMSISINIDSPNSLGFTFDWTTNRGDIPNGISTDKPTVTYKAPNTPGGATIEVMVHVTGCQDILKSKPITVVAPGAGNSPASPEAGSTSPPVTPTSFTPNGCKPTEVLIIYAPEEKDYLEDAIDEFNLRNECGIRVTGESGSSGTVAQGIVNAFIAPTHVYVKKPTIYSPSVRHWLYWVNLKTGKNVFNTEDRLDEGSPATANAPVVIAIWESRLKALERHNDGQPIGWEELYELFNSNEGWNDYYDNDTLPDNRKTVYYGHTNPFESSTALSTLIAEFSASARYHAQKSNSNEPFVITEEQIDENVLEGVRLIEQAIRIHFPRTIEFREYIVKGRDYVDIVALEENDLIAINRKIQGSKEKLVALYPKEGTFMHDHPFAIPNAEWVDEEQRNAAQEFTKFILSEEIQKNVLENGFRPVNRNVPRAGPFANDSLGVNPEQPQKVLEWPRAEIMQTVQNYWEDIQKQADVLLLIDISSSMSSTKLQRAQSAAFDFLQNMSSNNRVGLMIFNDTVNYPVELEYLNNQQKEKLEEGIRNIVSGGETVLYDGILDAIIKLESATEDSPNRIRGIVILSDGHDNRSKKLTKQSVLDMIKDHHIKHNLLILPIGYGEKADTDFLNQVAQNSATIFSHANTDDIEALLEVMANFFGILKSE